MFGNSNLAGSCLHPAWQYSSRQIKLSQVAVVALRSLALGCANCCWSVLCSLVYM